MLSDYIAFKYQVSLRLYPTGIQMSSFISNDLLKELGCTK